jgi:hypothetical protein
MAWLVLLLALSCLVEPFFTASVALGACSMLLSLILTVVGMMMLLSARRNEIVRDR